MFQNMFNNNNNNNNNIGHHHHDQMMGPRISFSSDFVNVDANQLRYEMGTAYKEAPVSSDFEFSVMDAGCGPSLAPADEIFHQGKLLPAVDDMGYYGGDQARNRITTTLREELMVGDGEDGPPRRSSGRWMERLGLKKGRRQRGGKSLETVEEEVSSQDTTTRKQQEMLAEGGRQSFRSTRG